MKGLEELRALIIFTINIIKNFVLSNKRFIRLTSILHGRIYFYDKKTKETFFVFARDSTDTLTADQVFTHGDYDLSFLCRSPEIKTVYENTLLENKIPLIIDCGANIGLTARYYAAEFESALIVSIEPEKGNFLELVKNCGDLPNIRITNSAIGCMDGFARILDDDAKNNAFRTSRTSSGIGGIPIISVNTLLRDYGDCVPFIIKIDIEGFEEELFSINTEWIEKFPVLIIETHDWMLPRRANSMNFLKAISRENRDFITRGEHVFSIRNE